MSDRVNGQPPMVYLEWIDSTRTEGWCTAKEVAEVTALEIKTVGILVREDEREIVVALCCTAQPDAGSPYCSLMTIPQKMISLRADVTANYPTQLDSGSSANE